ncbi:MAG: tetratricopeptide repeat protein [Pseudomonadota bacterium]
MRVALALIALLALPSAARALPAENHWTTEADPASAAKLEESVQLIEQEAYDQALPILEDLAKTQPANADVLNLLGFAHRKTGNLDLSGAYYQRALYLKPDHLGALEYQGELFLLQGNIQGAKDNLRRLEILCAEGCEEREELDEAIRGWLAQ